MKKNLGIAIGALSLLSLLVVGCQKPDTPNTPQKVSEIKFEKEAIDLSINESMQLKLVVTPKEATLDKNSTTWTSSDPKIATVKDGTVTGMAEGRATISARAEGLEAKCTVEVKAKGLEVDFELRALAKTSATVKITPKDLNMRYYYYAMSLSKYKRESTYSDAGIFGFEKSWFQFLSQSNPDKSWDELFLESCTKGVTVLELPKQRYLPTLSPDSTYVVYAYAVGDNAEPVGKVCTMQFTTKPSEKKNIKFEVQIENTYVNGVDATIKPSTNDKYSVSVQRKTFVDFYKEKNLEHSMAVKIIEADIETGVSPMLLQGEFRLTPEYRKATKKNADYFIVIFAYDEENGVGSDITYIPFRTKK